jgi:phosphatidyl-myo-inositol dimannoside synthase
MSAHPTGSRMSPAAPPAARTAEDARRAVGRTRYVVLTPGMTGSDGIAAVSRLVVAAVGGDEVRVLSLGDHAGPHVPASPSSGISVHAAGGRTLRFVASALRTTARLPPPAEVICLHLGLSPVAWLATKGRGRLTVFLHGIEAWRPLGTMRRWLLGRADILVANSEHTARRFRDANPVLADKPIRVCHLGAGPSPGTNDQASRTVDPPFALIVGRMAAAERYKGHDLLLDVWPMVAAALPEARLVVAGDGDDRARLEARARALDGRVTFLGRVADAALESLYRDCAFFVMPSRDEGFGLVFLEAMRAGKACIGSVGAAAEVIEDGVTGLVVDSEDPEQVIAAVRRLFRESETRARMGRSGAERFARHFTEAHFRRRFRTALGLSPEMA